MVPGTVHCWFSGAIWPQNDPKLEPKIVLEFNFLGVVFWTIFWTTLGSFWGLFSGPDRAKKEPRWVQEGHWELQRPKKLHLQKPQKQLFFSGFWGPEASQDEHKRLRKAPKRHLESFKTSKKVLKTEPKNNICLIIFGAVLGSQIGLLSHRVPKKKLKDPKKL